MKTLRSSGHSAWVVALVAASPLLQGADGCVAGGKIVVGSGNADNDAGVGLDAGVAEFDRAAPPVVDAAGGQDVTQDVTVMSADGGVGNAEGGQGGGTCQYPPNVQVESDGLGVGGCFAEPPVQLCQAGGCSSMCPGSQYELYCRSQEAVGSSIPQPDSTLGCQIIVIPTPSNALFYCCPCVGTGDASVADSGSSVEASDASDASSAVDVDSGAPIVEDAGTLVLVAYGGVSGEVSAFAYELIPDPDVGPNPMYPGPVDAGACQLTSGPSGPGGTIIDPLPEYGDFGPIAVSVGTATEPLTYDGYGYSTVDFPSSVTLGTGGIMTFHGGNGTSVPTFDISATIPGLAVITSPVPMTDGGAAIIDTSQDLTVTWMPIPIGQITFELDNGGSASLGGGLDVSVTCTFGGAAGSGVVPHTLLALIKEMSDAGPMSAGVSSGLEATTVVDGLTIVTQSYQFSPTTSRYVNVTLQ
jgi:hypothetical protein